MCKENEKETVVEINEAIIAGKRALSALKEARQSLKCASDWGIADLVGGGFFINMIKHSKLEDASQKLESAKQHIQVFQQELSDVVLPYEIHIRVDGFLTFADFFFDGLIADWLVQSRLKEAREEIDNASYYVSTTITDLQNYEKQYMLEKGAY